jgi:4-amino-4-deoxy-L-arabinose transferase-like glycosyltransferase
MRFRTPGVRSTATALGCFAAFEVLVVVIRAERAVLFWWAEAPRPFVVLSWTWVLLRAAATGLAMAWLFRLLEPSLPRRETSPAAGRTAVWVFVLTAVGGALRFAFPASVPPGVWLDVLFEAERLLRSPGNLPFLGGTPLGLSNAHEIVSHLLLRAYEVLLLTFGRGDVGILSLSAVPGALTIPAAAWLAYEAFGARAAILAATFVAFSSRSLALSRWGYTPATLVPLGMAAMAAALSARRRSSLLLAALSGAFAGLAMHTHSSALIVPVALAAWTFGTWREPGARSRAAAAAATAFLCAGPWLLGFLQHPGYVGGRLRDVNIGNPVRDIEMRDAGPVARLSSNLVDYSGLFVFTHDPNSRHGFPGRPAATVVLGVAALIGFAALFRRSIEDPGAPRGVLWLAAGSLTAGILSDPGGAPNTVRACLLVPAGLVVAAWVVDGTIRAVALRVGARIGPLFVLVGAMFFTRETVPFFTDWPHDPRVVAAFCPEESDAGRLLRRLSGSNVVLGQNVVQWPLVLETLAGPPDSRLPVPRFPVRTPDQLLAVPPRGPFWLVAPRGYPEPLVVGGWRVSRPVEVGTGRALHIFRVVPKVT